MHRSRKTCPRRSTIEVRDLQTFICLATLGLEDRGDGKQASSIPQVSFCLATLSLNRMGRIDTAIMVIRQPEQFNSGAACER